MDEAQIVLKAILQGIRTTPDGGWRVTLDIDESMAEEVLKLSKLRDAVINAVFIPSQV